MTVTRATGEAEHREVPGGWDEEVGKQHRGMTGEIITTNVFKTNTTFSQSFKNNTEYLF